MQRWDARALLQARLAGWGGRETKAHSNSVPSCYQ